MGCYIISFEIWYIFMLGSGALSETWLFFKCLGLGKKSTARIGICYYLVLCRFPDSSAKQVY